jgi:HrpA-like RNA helicase
MLKVFVAGVLDIQQCVRAVEGISSDVSERLVVMPLHSALTGDEYGAHFPTAIGTRGYHRFPRLLA